MIASTEQEEEFTFNLGRSLVDWQWVEDGAYSLFCTFMKGANPKLTSIIFHHIQSFDSQINLLNKCAYFVIPEGHLADRWHKKKVGGLKKRLLDQMIVRNRIVHFKYHLGGGKGVPPVSLGPSYMDASYAINDRWKNPEYEIDLPRLHKAQRDFNKLADDLCRLRDDIEDMSE